MPIRKCVPGVSANLALEIEYSEKPCLDVFNLIVHPLLFTSRESLCNSRLLKDRKMGENRNNLEVKMEKQYRKLKFVRGD